MRMRGAPALLLLALLRGSLALAAEAATPPEPPACGPGAARLDVQFNWTPPEDSAFPATRNPGFSALVCAVHGADYVMWRSGYLASAAVARMAAAADAAPLLAELAAAAAHGKVSFFRELSVPISDPANPGAPSSASPGAPTLSPTAAVTVELPLNGSTGATQVSCIAAIRPSPDFFVGMSSLDLCVRELSKYNQSIVRRLSPWKAGTVGGLEYTSAIGPLSPEKVQPIEPLLGLASSYGTAMFQLINGSGIPSINEDPNGAAGARADCFPGSELVSILQHVDDAGDGNDEDNDLRSNKTTSRGKRFSASTVILQVPMRSLRLGHIANLGRLSSPSSIFMFSHADADAVSIFVQIRTTSTTVTLSPGHYIYAYVRGGATSARAGDNIAGTVLSNGTGSSAAELVRAGMVVPGDALVSPSGLRLAVTSVSRVRARGLYNPHSLSGDLVVSGVRVSCYTTAVPPRFAHALLAPVRALHQAGCVRIVAWVGAAVRSRTIRRTIERFFAGDRR
jgi:Spondin_N/Hint module